MAGPVEAALRRRDAKVRVRTPVSAAEARVWARELAEREVIVAVLGGDGSANDVASQLIGGQAWLAALPGGTESLISRSAGCPPDPVAAAEALLAGKPADWDAGTLGGRPFFGFAGVGFDGRVCARAEGKLRQRMGNIVYWGVTAACLTLPPSRFELKWAEGSLSGVHEAIFCNVPLFGGGLKISPAAEPADGLLDAAIFPWRGYFARLGQLMGAFSPRIAPSGLAPVRARLTEAKIEDTGELPAQIDGDPVTVTSPEIGIRPAAIKVLNAACRKGR